MYSTGIPIAYREGTDRYTQEPHNPIISMSSSPVIIVTGDPPHCSTDISICTDSWPTSRIPPGASKGLGLAVTQILLSTFNAKIVAVSRSIPQELETLRSSSDHRERVEIVQGDVGSDETSAHAVKVALERFGRIDGLVLNAGTIDPLGQYLETLLDPFDWTPSPRLTRLPFLPPGFVDFR
jgi:hypothetical protein